MPASANLIAVAAPIPRDAPVMIATLPARLIICHWGAGRYARVRTARSRRALARYYDRTLAAIATARGTYPIINRRLRLLLPDQTQPPSDAALRAVESKPARRSPSLQRKPRSTHFGSRTPARSWKAPEEPARPLPTLLPSSTPRPCWSDPVPALEPSPRLLESSTTT